MIRIALALLVALSSCAASQPAAMQSNARSSMRGIMYDSHIPGQFLLFSPDGARSGPYLSLLPEFPPETTRYFEPGDGIHCVSIGMPGNSDDYAIKRPIRAGDTYQCLRTTFRVVRCFEDCRAAVIQQERLLVNNRRLTSSFFVSNCRGVLAISAAADMVEGIPFDAMMLRSNVGILADPAFPRC